MILACPNCGAQFAVDDAVLGRAGRRVRCSACRHEWRASAPPPAETPASAAPPISAPMPAPLPDRIEAAAVIPPAAAEAPAPPPAPETPPPQAERPRRPPVEQAAALRRSGGRWLRVGWALLVIVVALGAAGAALREQVVCRYPELDSYYARFGIASPEASDGLILAGSSVQFETRDNVRFLVARAEIANVGNCARRVPLRSLLVDASGRTRGEAQFVSPAPVLRSGENTVIRLEVRAPPDAVTGVALPDLRHAGR